MTDLKTHIATARNAISPLAVTACRSLDDQARILEVTAKAITSLPLKYQEQS